MLGARGLAARLSRFRSFSKQCCAPRQLIFASSAVCDQHGMQFYRRALPDTCISFSSPEGKDIFREALASGHMECYFKLASQFRTQDDPAFCGLATLVMVLNSLEVDPKRVWKGPWRWYHEEMLDCCTSLDSIRTQGITFDQFSCLATCNGLTVLEECRVDATADKAHFRQLITEVTSRDDRILVLAYSRKTVQQTGDGHYASVGGYHPDEDLVLLFDTARFKYPPHWLPVDLLWESMHALDKETQKPRGYFLLEKLESKGLVLFHVNAHLNAALLHAANCPPAESCGRMLKAWRFWAQWTAAPRDASGSVLETAVARIAEALEMSGGRQNFFLQVQTLCRDLENMRAQVLERLEATDFAKEVTALLVAEEARRGAADGPNGSCCGEQDPRMARLCVTGFLLAFPYPEAEGAWGAAMRQEVAAALAVAPSGDHLRDELTRLREILVVLMDFSRREET